MTAAIVARDLTRTCRGGRGVFELALLLALAAAAAAVALVRFRRRDVLA